jgi:hypothetical protein
MRASISEATATFLEVAGEDLQRQLGSSGTVVGMDADSAPDGSITLVAAVRIGASTLEMIGTGDGLVAAYGDLHQHVAEPVLAAAFRDYLVTRVKL